MIQSRQWERIERLPDDPNVAKMTGDGYWLGGTFYPSRVAAAASEQPRKRLWERIVGK